MIPANIDAIELLNDLNTRGWLDEKISVACGWSSGYIAQIRAGRIAQMKYQNAARLVNFWASENMAEAGAPIVFPQRCTLDPIVDFAALPAEAFVRTSVVATLAGVDPATVLRWGAAGILRSYVSPGSGTWKAWHVGDLRRIMANVAAPNVSTKPLKAVTT